VGTQPLASPARFEFAPYCFCPRWGAMGPAPLLWEEPFPPPPPPPLYISATLRETALAVWRPRKAASSGRFYAGNLQNRAGGPLAVGRDLKDAFAPDVPPGNIAADWPGGDVNSVFSLATSTAYPRPQRLFFLPLIARENDLPSKTNPEPGSSALLRRLCDRVSHWADLILRQLNSAGSAGGSG